MGSDIQNLPTIDLIMASEVSRKLENAKISMDERCVSDIQTSGATPTLAYTTPVIPTNTVASIEVWVLSVNSGFTLARTGYVVGTALRASGNVLVQSVPISDLVGALTVGGVSFTANTTNQTVEIYVTGIAATTINWRLAIYQRTLK